MGYAYAAGGFNQLMFQHILNPMFQQFKLKTGASNIQFNAE